jgi:dGTP triphosphohydrolase
MNELPDSVRLKVEKLSENAERADKSIGIPVNEIATSNKGITRIKGIDLLTKNQNEPHWPGERTHFQIDRDQIIYNPNFVRRARKTQVFIGQRDALYKNRLMHSLEVVQFSQSVACGTKDSSRPVLNQDLVGAIAYGHDIGHTPFGHAGEETLNACLYEYYVRDILKTLSKHERSFDSSPCVHPGQGDTETERVWRRDNAIWMFVERGAEPLKRQEAEALLGASLLGDLKTLNVLQIEDDACYFNPPYKWQWEEGEAKHMQREYWLDETSREFFAHNVHALRVLLADNSRPKSDITHHTAWGILAHTPRKYNKFTCFLPSGPVCLTDALETPEAFLIRQADDICFANSDLEDARRSKLIEWNDLDEAEREAIWGLAVAYRHVGNDFPDNSQRLQFCGQGFHFAKGSSSSYENDERVKAARNVMRKRVYPVLASRQAAARRIIRDLFWFYACPQPKTKKRDIDETAWAERDRFVQDRVMDAGASFPRVATDFIAHMTDEEIIDTHRALFSPEHARWARYFMKSGPDS